MPRKEILIDQYDCEPAASLGLRLKAVDGGMRMLPGHHADVETLLRIEGRVRSHAQPLVGASDDAAEAVVDRAFIGEPLDQVERS